MDEIIELVELVEWLEGQIKHYQTQFQQLDEGVGRGSGYARDSQMNINAKQVELERVLAHIKHEYRLEE